MKNKKKAQVQVTFNWIYILIAGVVILLFFAGIVIKQKASAEKGLQQDVVKSLESILVGAGVSEKTKNFVETSGLSDYVLEFKCDQDGSSTFGIEDGSQVETKLKPFFAPAEIKTNQLILWSLPYNLPYKVMDLLIVSSTNTKYFVLGDGAFKDELEKAVSREPGEKAEFNFEFITSPDAIDAGNNYQARVIDLAGTYVRDKGSVPSDLVSLDDSKVTGVVLSGGNGPITYFQKKGSIWERLDSPVPIISLGQEKDAAKYAALFAADGESYKCSMMKVFRRMKYVNEVYTGKLNEIEKYYQDPTVDGAPYCKNLAIKFMKITLSALGGATSSCIFGGYDSCTSIITHASELKTSNSDLAVKCISLY
ncbi:MAG: hypothetical protein ACFFDN_37545 [Candidatus Hodarchaeota archaeon]